MRIAKNEKIGGVPILKVRDYFRMVESSVVSKNELKECLSLDESEVDVLLNELVINDFLELSEAKYQLTLKGRALCVARCMSPMNKAKADKIFKEFMQRVEEVNNDDDYLLRVSKLLLFGSYLNPDKADFGDIDIAFELERKIDDFDKFLELNEKLVEDAAAKGKRFPTIIEELGYSERLVLLKLKNKEKYISLHPMTDKILEIAEYKQIFP